MRWLPLFVLALAPLVPLRADDAPKGKIVYSHKDGERYLLHMMNADGSGDRELPGQTANVNLFPAWSPDGKKIAFMAGSSAQFRDFQLCVMNPDGTGLIIFNIPSKIAGLPAWSPDGKMLAYAGGDERPNVFVCDADGGNSRKLNPDGCAAIFPFWVGEGKVGYSRLTENEMKADIVLSKVDGTGLESLITSDKVAFSGAHGVSPDGRRLVFVVADPGAMNASVRIWDFATKGETTVTEFEVPREEGPKSFPAVSWAPDGKSILTTLPTDKGFGVFRVTEDGKKTRLTPEGVDCFTPAWHAPK